MKTKPPAVTETALPESVSEADEPVSSDGFREERFFLILAVFIGILSGLAVVCFPGGHRVESA